MEAELTICNDANLRMSNLIVEIDKEQISEEVEKDRKLLQDLFSLKNI